MSNRQFLFFIFGLIIVAGLLLATFRPEVFDRYIARFLPGAKPEVFIIKGIGVIGDSLSDEYQADDARGYEYAPTTLNWVEQLVKSRKLNFGVWNQWGDVRRTGFQFNWSRSGSTTKDAINNNQHTGLAQYISEGKVNVVIVYIGGNDFSPFNTTDGYLPIYNETLSDSAVEEKIKNVVKNIETILDDIKKTKQKDLKIMLMTIPDWNLSPVIQLANRNDEGRERVSKAIKETNEYILKIASQRNIALVDVNVFYKKLLSEALLGSIKVGSENISLYIPGDDPKRAFLSDTIHPGTVLNGLFANFLLKKMNQDFHTNIPPLTDDEILKNAGLKV